MSGAAGPRPQVRGEPLAQPVAAEVDSDGAEAHRPPRPARRPPPAPAPSLDCGGKGKEYDGPEHAGMLIVKGYFLDTNGGSYEYLSYRLAGFPFLRARPSDANLSWIDR